MNLSNRDFTKYSFLRNNAARIIITFIVVTLSSGFVFAKETTKTGTFASMLLSDVLKLASQKGIHELAKQHGFVQETDPERLNFYQNKKANATIQVLNRDGLYIPIRYFGYEKACAIATAMVAANLESPKISKSEPYWPGQAFIISNWKGQGKQSHIHIRCEQYGDEGSSSVGISVNFSKLELAE